MKKTIIIMCLVTALLLSISLITPSIFAEEECDFSHYVISSDTHQIIDAKREDERHPIASMVKIMCLNLIFEEVDAGRLNYDDEVIISHNAASQTGSELFLDEGVSYKVDDLIKGIVVVSANDATVALAEKIANSDDKFVMMMNDKAKEWGLDNTHFANSTGLPHKDGYSSAKDVTIMMQHLLEHDKYYEYASIWNQEFMHPSGRITALTNTNKLIRFYDGCDAGKTGFTNEAGFCLSVSAKRDGNRYIATTIGSKSSKGRFKVASDLLNRAFKEKVNVLKHENEAVDNSIIVKKARGAKVDLVYKDDVKGIMSHDKTHKIILEYDIPSIVEAPISQGQKLGECHVKDNDMLLYTVDLVAAKAVPKAHLFDDFKDLARR